MQRNRTPGLVFAGKPMETETTTWLEFLNGEKAISKQTLKSEEKNKSRRAELRGSQSETRVGKLSIWVKINTLTDGLIERTSSMWDEVESKTVRKEEEDSW